jgi:hypothetical protein
MPDDILIVLRDAMVNLFCTVIIGSVKEFVCCMRSRENGESQLSIFIAQNTNMFRNCCVKHKIVANRFNPKVSL